MTDPSDPADSPAPPAAHELLATQVEAAAITQIREVFANARAADALRILESLPSEPPEPGDEMPD